MSASLVGSEMCIRDRGLGVARGILGALETQSNGLRLILQARRSVRVPVSYTHLTLPTICSV
eukprot:4935173-Alexandrium_andersonii.AAC.1